MDTKKPSSARDIGLMSGFPPLPEKLVTHKNQLYAPFNRWSFQNELKLNRTADVWRGRGPAAEFLTDFQDLSEVTYKNFAGTEFSFEDMLNLSYTDGILVLHHGKVIFERYFNDMQSHSLHAWASGSKSMTGALAAMLVHERLLDAEKLVPEYLPELGKSGYADVTIRQVLDMTSAVGFPDEITDPIAENWQYGVALGWCEKPENYSGAESVYEMLPLLQKTGEHGQRFTYLTPNTDVLAWIIKRLTHQSLAELMQEYIWSKLGAERDAYWIVDPSGAETAGSGLVTTLADKARFGQMMLQDGFFNGQQIIPAAVITDIKGGADPRFLPADRLQDPETRVFLIIINGGLRIISVKPIRLWGTEDSTFILPQEQTW